MLCPLPPPPPPGVCHQADGTLQELLSDEAVLQRLLAPLGGTAGGSIAGGSSAAAEANAGAAAVNGVGAQQQDGAAAKGSSSSSSSSLRDPDYGVREALAEAIAVLVGTRGYVIALLYWWVPEPM